LTQYRDNNNNRDNPKASAINLTINLLRRHGGTALFKSMAEHLCWQNLRPPSKD